MRYEDTNSDLHAEVLGLSYNQLSEEIRLVELDMRFEILIEAPHTKHYTHTHTHTHKPRRR